MAIPTPVSFWNLDESSGNAADAVGSNTLTNTGTMTYGTGKINNGAIPSTTGPKYLSITDAAQTGLDFSDTFSIFLWVNFSTVITGNNIFVMRRVSVANQRAYDFYATNTTMNTDWWTDGSAIGGSVSVTWSPTTATWYHVGVTKSGTTAKFWLNGVQQGADQTGTSATVFNSTAVMEVGFWGVTSDGLNATIDMLGMWDVALASGDITSLYNAGTGVQYPFTTAGATSHNLSTLGAGS